MSEKLSFNEMLDKCWKTALGISPLVKLYQASSPDDVSFMHSIFRGDDEYATIMVNCTNKGKISIQYVDSPYMDDCVIHPPIKMSLNDAECCLQESEYGGDWSVVVLREPLYSIKYPPLYIFTVEHQGYIAVSTEDGSVFPLDA